MRMNGKLTGKLAPGVGNWSTRKSTLSGSVTVRFTGMSFTPFGLPLKFVSEKRGFAKSGSPVAVLSAQMRTLGKIAGNGGRPTCWLNVKDGNVTLLMLYGGVNGRSNRFARYPPLRKLTMFSNAPNCAMATWPGKVLVMKLIPAGLAPAATATGA